MIDGATKFPGLHKGDPAPCKDQFLLVAIPIHEYLQRVPDRQNTAAGYEQVDIRSWSLAVFWKIQKQAGVHFTAAALIGA